MNIINEARINFNYRLAEDKPVIFKTVLSNKVMTLIIPKTLCITKYVDKYYGSLYEILTYTNIIYNCSNNVVSDLYFKDNLSPDLKYIKGSLLINYKKTSHNDLAKPIYIGDIQANGKVTIIFKAVIINIPQDHKIRNYFTIKYNYPVCGTGIICNDSNVICTMVNNLLFKQFNVGNTILICKDHPKINKIISVKQCIKPVKTKVIKTRCYYNECFKKNYIYQLLIIGKIQYEILYEYKKCNATEEWSDLKKYRCSVVEGFSVSIMVPAGAKYIEEFNVEFELENSFYRLADNRKVYISSNILLKIQEH